ncbi:MAG: polymer-forming cytoskeletal protein [Candidatus Magasanikbacteria bacterium]|nr:polymer-forming cytoskeletal protein [Candidatus Magasanikbacteria bacterium]
MIFQKISAPHKTETAAPVWEPYEIRPDEVETVVGPSVNVEGDFASEGNIVVKGSVAGSVHTSKHLSVEVGARIMANVRAGSAKVAGEVRGNLRLKESLELTASARVVGDIEAKILVVEAGALIFGKVAMPGIEGIEVKGGKAKALPSRKAENAPPPAV